MKNRGKLLKIQTVLMVMASNFHFDIASTLMTQLKRIRTVVAKFNHLFCIFHMPMERIRVCEQRLQWRLEVLKQTRNNYSNHAPLQL